MGCFQSKVAGPLPPNDAAALPADKPADPGNRHAPSPAAA
jgi:BR-signaling kinase